MSKTPTGQRSLLPISSAGDSPAKTSAQQAEEKASKVVEAVFGTSSRESLKSFLPRGWSSKTSVAQLIDGWMPCDSTWESAAMRAYRSRLQQKMQVLRTDEAEFLLWPTVVTTDEASSGRATTLAKMKPGTSLTDAMRAWPTPTASEYGTSGNGCPGDGREEYAHKGTPSLHTLVRKGWATPTARDEKGPNPNKRKGGRDLATDVSTWSTPKASDDKRGASPHRGRRASNPSGGDRDLPTDVATFRHDPTIEQAGDSGSPKAVLNPEFVRALMGFPEGWLDVE